MCESQRNILAIITLRKKCQFDVINCVCSRAFVWYKAEQYPSIENSPDEINLHTVQVKSEGENETVSCYYSASHTDTLSTDEHDSLRESSEGRPFLRSDSGTDLTNSTKYDIFLDWKIYWSLNGEKLIWESWIAKYSDYINPEYLGYCGESNGQLVEENIKSEIPRPQVTKFHFEDCELKNIQINNPKVFQRESSENDDTLNNDISEGWNPLSPLSNDGDTENEQLLRPRCSSHTGSSVRTVDSMTNVTRMTISSIDFNKSPADSLSSVSSVESSISTTTSEEDEDNQNEWNHLWKIHYEEEYLVQYNKFLADRDYRNTLEPPHRSLKHSGQQTVPIEKSDNSSIKEYLDKRHLEKIFSNLDMENESSDNSELLDKEEPICDEKIKMSCLGLPLSFGKPDDNTVSKSKKASAEKSSSNSSRNKIKAAFYVLGIEYAENKGDLVEGEVEYKMKHINSQNRLLRLRGEKRPRHTYFDDEGNPILENKDEEVPTGNLSDCSENKISSPEEENNTSEQTNTNEEMIETDHCVPKKRKRRKKLNIPSEIKENPKLKKYWLKRFTLFRRFDQGIKLDEESWYSVTPELVAKNTAERCRTDVLVDGFCGAGGNAIQFALTCKKVIAIDIDPKKIELAKNNAAVYGVLDKIEFIVGDFFSLAAEIKGDVVFLSPPWGGPSYLSSKTYDLESMLQPVPFSQLMDASKQISQNIAVFLPKNSNTSDVMKHAGQNGFVEIEQNFINDHLIGITVYYNDLVKM
ncbi:uncharacterized protein LOC123673103 [Harmonia axyridis]|uniref:uncharacterized protein LOC123673103 n=1 Tax=Harmonia axyridis TaxID=115357 RepID=UPI001E275843|nr:uncharacterized protein LOC123673103 [Harmonia axyridis]